MIPAKKYILDPCAIYKIHAFNVWKRGPKKGYTFITEIILLSVTSAYIYKIIWRDLAVKNPKHNFFYNDTFKGKNQ